ncbi:MAG: TolB family protein, partial [Acidimicrobiales bacterium]
MKQRVLALGSVIAVVAAIMVANVAEGAFPGTNGRIVFISDRDGDNEVFTMNPDGSNQVNLTNNTATEFEPAWSADGTKIVFVSNRDANNEIYTMNSDGMN